jgi:ADP-ribose pyrophosphatase
VTGRTVHENPWFSVSLTEDGNERWYRVQRPDSALLLGVDGEGHILMIKGMRDTAGGAALLELPCGGIDQFEAPEAAAIRETREETGWCASALEFIGSFIESPGISASRCFVFTARVMPDQKPHQEPGEAWSVVSVPAESIAQLISTGQIQDAGTLAAFALYSAKVNGKLGVSP